MTTKNYVLLSMIIFSLVGLIPLASATINITLDEKDVTYLKWSWTPNLSITNLSIDGYTVILADKADNKFILSDLNPNETHMLRVYTLTDTGYIVSTTSELTPEEKKSVDLFWDFVMSYIILFTTLGLMLVGTRIPLASIIGMLFALIGMTAAFLQGNYILDLMYICLFFGSTMVSYVGMKK